MTKAPARDDGVSRTSLRLAFIFCGLSAFAVAASCSAFPENITGPQDGSGAVSDSGSGSDGGFGGDGGLTAANACSLMNSRKCDYLQRCGLIAPGQQALRDCASILVTTECGPSLWPSRVAVGTLRFYSTIARGCAESYVVRKCEDFQGVPDLCGQFVTPGSALNAACYGGSFRECQTGVCRGLSCPRLCRPPGTLGEDCNGNDDCATDAGLYCVPGGTSSSGSCSAYASADAGCNAITRCADGLVCSSNARCQPLRNSGEPCEESSCVKTSWCAISTDGGGVCETRSANGQSCTDDRQCREGSLCVPESGLCDSRGPLVRGSACGTGQRCANGTSCVGLNASALGSCETPYVLDELCEANGDCVSHLACVSQDAGSELRCGVRREDGQACTLDRDCQLFSACRAGTCFRLPRLGEGCTGNTCVYGSCTQTTADGGSTCSGLLPPNALCTFDAECSSARCAAGSCLAACTP